MNFQLSAMRLLRLLSITISIFLTSSILLCQDNINAIEFRHLTIKDGLPSNIIYSITQDTEGFMWFATTDGLVRHDGYSMKVFRRGNSVGQLKDNYIYDVFCDSKGRIWVGTNYHGLFLFNPVNELFSNIKFAFPDSVNIESNRIRKIKEDAAGNIWACTQANGLIKYNHDTGEEKIYRHNPEDKNSLPSNLVFDIDFDSLGNAWIATMDMGISYFDLEKNKFTDYQHNPTNTNSLSSNITYKILNDGSLTFIGTQNGTSLFNEKKQNFSQLTDRETLDILKTSDGDFYFCTNSGLIIIKAPGRKHTYEFNSSQPKGLSNNNVYCAYEDKAGVIWIGTKGGGINIYYPQKKNFDVFQHDPSNSKSIGSNIIRGFSEDKDGTIWVASTDKGIEVLNEVENSFHKLSGDGYKDIRLKNNSIVKIYHDKAGNLWVGTWGQGVYLLPTGEKKFKHFSHDTYNNNTLQDNVVLDIFEDSQGNMWFGTESGFDIFSVQKNMFRHFKHSNTDTNSITALGIQSNCIVEDINGNFWVGTYGGLNYLERKHKTRKIFEDDFAIKNITVNSKADISISENRIINMNYDPVLYPNKIHIGTYGGGLQAVYFKNGGPEKILKYTTADGLSNNVIYGILTDTKGNLWMSTNSGLTKFDIEQYIFKTYGINDGLQGYQFYWGASFKDSDNRLYFGGINGFNRFYPDSIVDNEYLPPIVFTDFRIFNKSVSVGDTINDRIILNKSINHQEEILLTSDENVFSIEFAALHFAYPDDNMYEYMLEGFDNEYIDVGYNQRLVTYTNLDPGTYIFKVRAANFDGVWNDYNKSIKIKILPPLYKRTWYRILVVLLIGLLIVLYFYVRMATINRQKKLLKILVNQKTKSLNTTNKKLVAQADELNEKNRLLMERQQKVEEQANEIHLQAKILQQTNEELLQSNAAKDKFFSILSHDLRNPFNLIMGSSEILHKRFDNLSDEKKKGYSRKIYESTKNTFRLLENLLSWSRAQSKQIKPQLIPLMVFDVIDQNIIVVEQKLKKKEITLIKDIDQSLMINADINMINHIVQNILTNAMKFTPRKGEIKIIAEKEDDMVFIHFIDNGVGMSEDTVNALFRIDKSISYPGTEGETGTGLGLILTHEFVGANDGSISVESKPGKGTTISVAFPIEQL